jgi:hypothetical protein
LKLLRRAARENVQIEEHVSGAPSHVVTGEISA